MTSDWDDLDRARSGDEEAWRVLVQRHNPPLMKMTFLITGSLEAAQDLVQETFIRVMRANIKYRDGYLKTYLSTIAYRLALKEKKRGQRHRNLDNGDIADESPSPLDSAVRDERNGHIARAITSLPNHHRDILVLRFYGGHSYEEISRMTNLPLGTVKSRIFYAVKTCRERLQEEGIL